MNLHTQPFSITNQTFSERVGEPDEFTCALGRIAVCFSYLDKELDKAIGQLIDLDNDIVEIITAEMSFRNKMHLLSSMVRKLYTPNHYCPAKS